MLRMTSELNCQLLISASVLCLNLINPVTPYKDYPSQGFTSLKHSEALSPKSGVINPILTYTQILQVLDRIQKPSITVLEI